MVGFFELAVLVVVCGVLLGGVEVGWLIVVIGLAVPVVFADLLAGCCASN